MTTRSFFKKKVLQWDEEMFFGQGFRRLELRQRAFVFAILSFFRLPLIMCVGLWCSICGCTPVALVSSMLLLTNSVPNAPLVQSINTSIRTFFLTRPLSLSLPVPLPFLEKHYPWAAKTRSPSIMFSLRFFRAQVSWSRRQSSCPRFQ